MKVLVTGAGGYIGRYVVKSLLDLGHEVIAVDFILNGIDDRADRFVYDIFKKSDSLYKDLKSPEIMIHMAWKDGFMHNSNAHMDFLSCHYQFVMDMVDQGLKQVVVMGSMHEVGYYEGMIDEDTPTNPCSLYGISKDALRRSLMISMKNKDALLQWVRAFYILGDDEKNSSIFAKLIVANKEGKKTFPFTTGTNKYDFISIQDLGFQIAKVATQNKIGGVINCCSGKPQSLKDVVEEFIKEKELDITLEYGAFPDRPYDSKLIYGDSKKINEILKD